MTATIPPWSHLEVKLLSAPRRLSFMHNVDETERNFHVATNASCIAFLFPLDDENASQPSLNQPVSTTIAAATVKLNMHPNSSQRNKATLL